MPSSSQDEKEIFFKGLDELDELALEDDGNATISFEENTTQSYSANIIPSERSSSQEASNQQVELACASKTTGTGPPALSTKKTIPAQSSKCRSATPQVPPMLSKKQSGKKSFKLQPEDAQIFRGLTFCENTRSQPPPLAHLTAIRFFAKQRHRNNKKEAY
jgi:hypothetical protein